MSTAKLDSVAALPVLERIRWAARTYPGKVVATSSFGADSAVLLHQIALAAPEIPVLLLNTGFLFEETLTFKADLQQRLNLDVREIKPEVSREEFLDRHGPAYEDNPNFCCDRNKVQPLRHALVGVSCWITGIRHDQTADRRFMRVVGQQPDGMVKLNPLLEWTQAQVESYLTEHELPRNPLVAEGYGSIGCWPCTALPADLSDLRSGRWAGHDKTECGIHLPHIPADAAPMEKHHGK